MPPKKKVAEPTGAVRFGRASGNLKMGLVGLPNVGKSSLFNLLTEQSIPAENFPFCTIEPNEARCAVPDERYDFLVDLWNPPSRYPAYLQVTDIAGLVKGASEGQGLGNAFLSHILAVDGLFHVVRAFENDEVVHVETTVDPARDLDIIQTELCLKDLDFLEKAYQTELKEIKKVQGKILPILPETVEKISALLKENKPVRDGEWSSAEVELINTKFRLLTTKPVIYLINISAEDYKRKKNKFLPKISQWVKDHGGGAMVPFSVEYEAQLWALREDADALTKFKTEAGVASVLPKIITLGFQSLSLIYYITAGEKEVRCWMIPEGCLAPQAAGVIHSDFERGFIKAEVVAFDDFKALAKSKGMAEVKAAGKYRQEGKTYVVQDGDIIHFQFNVTAKPAAKK